MLPCAIFVRRSSSSTLSRLAVVVLFTLSALGCEGTVVDDPSGPDGSSDGGQAQRPTCEVVSVSELADEHEVAPNGQTGAKLLAAVPASHHTSLAWELSTMSSGVEVEVPGTTGPSAVLDLSFSVPAEPRFWFEDRVVVEPDGDVTLDVEVICEDYVTTVVDVNIVTEDGTISLSLTGVTVRLGPDRPETDEVARPFVHETLAMPTPEVNFSKPVMLAASLDKVLALVFDHESGSVAGAITVYANTDSATYEQLVARW
jgi:hypothetical protein